MLSRQRDVAGARIERRTGMSTASAPDRRRRRCPRCRCRGGHRSRTARPARCPSTSSAWRMPDGDVVEDAEPHRGRRASHGGPAAGRCRTRCRRRRWRPVRPRGRRRRPHGARHVRVPVHQGVADRAAGSPRSARWRAMASTNAADHGRGPVARAWPRAHRRSAASRAARWTGAGHGSGAPDRGTRGGRAPSRGALTT